MTGTPGIVPLDSTPVNVALPVGLKPGLVIVVPVVKKEFKGPNPWVMISNFHVKIDGCVGQSFIRSYATLTQVTDQSDVVLSYVASPKPSDRGRPIDGAARPSRVHTSAVRTKVTRSGYFWPHVPMPSKRRV